MPKCANIVKWFIVRACSACSNIIILTLISIRYLLESFFSSHSAIVTQCSLRGAQASVLLVPLLKPKNADGCGRKGVRCKPYAKLQIRLWITRMTPHNGLVKVWDNNDHYLCCWPSGCWWKLDNCLSKKKRRMECQRQSERSKNKRQGWRVGTLNDMMQCTDS